MCSGLDRKWVMDKLQLDNLNVPDETSATDKRSSGRSG